MIVTVCDVLSNIGAGDWFLLADVWPLRVIEKRDENIYIYT